MKDYIGCLIKKKQLQTKTKRLWYRVMLEKRIPYKCRVPLAFLIELLRVAVKTIILTLISLVLILILLLSTEYRGTCVSSFNYALEVVINSKESDFKYISPSIIYDNKGKAIYSELNSYRSSYIDYKDIPKSVINIFSSVYDKNTRKSRVSLSWLGYLVRELVNNERDASLPKPTITQQLVSTMNLKYKSGIKADISSTLIAVGLSNKFSRAQLLEFYFNNVNFDTEVCGIERASEYYFGKSIDKLSIPEITHLAILATNSSVTDSDYKATIKSLRTSGILSDKEYKKYSNTTVRYTKDAPKLGYEASYAIDCAVRYLMARNGFEFRYLFNNEMDYASYQNTYRELYSIYDKRIKTGGYKIYTSLDSKVTSRLKRLYAKKLTSCERGVLTCIDNKTQKVVVALNIGGTSTGVRDLQASRKISSSLRPFAMYLPLIKDGYTGETLLTNGNFTLKDYISPFYDYTLPYDTMNKLPVFSVLSLLSSMKFDNVYPVDTATISTGASLVRDMTPVEMCSAYSMIANHGVFRQPTCLISIKDRNNKELYHDNKHTSICSSKVADDLVNLLSYKNKIIRCDNVDGKLVWASGTTSKYSISTWVGNDISSVYLKNTNIARELWLSTCKLLQGSKIKPFKRDLKSISYKAKLQRKGYWGYLRGRDDTEKVSDNYFVSEYRRDRVLGESVLQIIDTINTSKRLKKSQLSKYKKEGYNIISEVVDSKYAKNLEFQLNTAIAERSH